MPAYAAGLLSIAAVLLNLATATPLSRRDNTQPVGTNPIAKPQVTFLGFQTADNDCSHRDLGFTGAIAGKWYAVYGDTLYCKPGVTDPTKDDWQWHGMVRDSVSATTSNPLRVHDLNLNSNGRQNQFVPFNAAWGETNQYGFGGTSLCETDASAGTGALFYLVVSFKLHSRKTCQSLLIFISEQTRQRIKRCRRCQSQRHQRHSNSHPAHGCSGALVGI